MRPFWFQHQHLHTQLVDVLLHHTRALREEREARGATDRRLAQLESGMASTAGEIGRVERALSQAQWELGQAQRELGQAQRESDSTVHDHALRASREVQELNARLQHVTGELRRVSETADGLTERVARLGALDGRVSLLTGAVEQLTAGLAELHTVAASLRDEGTARLSALTALRSDVESLRASSAQVQTSLDARAAALSQADAETAARIATLAQADAEACASLASLVAGTGDLTRRVAALEPALASLQTASGTWVTNVAKHLEGLTHVVGQTEQSLATLDHRLFAVPYMTDPDHFLESDEHGRQRLGYSSTNGHHESGFYVGFEDLFRGPQSLIRDRQAVYLPLLRRASNVVDIGCGRGEMLDLLEAAHMPAMGVDIDPDMVAICRAKGHRVEQIDAVQFLRDRGERSLPAVFSAQVIEHLAFEELKAFLTLCRSRLRPGGTVIVETVNPHALEAFKTFYTDLSHQRPIFPEVALALTQLAGFDRAHVVFPLGTGTLIENRQTQGEYAVVATVENDD
jgi:2-polyprenyl-3-methyl-5-hydroxy-6-metoxy-1,4-benzoquinol methylase